MDRGKCETCQEIKMQKNESNEVLLMESILPKTSRKVKVGQNIWVFLKIITQVLTE